MLRDFKEHVVDSFMLGAYLVALVIAGHGRWREGWVIALVAMAGLAFVAWRISLARLMTIETMPTSRIASAAQGYVEIFGKALNHPGGPILSRFTLLPCVWYRYILEHRASNDKWERVESGRSDGSFILDDGTGTCLVDPENAEVVPRRKETWVKNDYRYTEWLILPQQRVYVLGEFATIGGSNSDFDFKRDVSEVLAQWKQDKPKLLARFDLDGDRQISEKEWMLARAEAQRKVKKQYAEVRAQSGTNMIRQPADGRLFLISDIDPTSLEMRYKIWAWLHLCVFLGAVAGTAWLVMQ